MFAFSFISWAAEKSKSGLPPTDVERCTFHFSYILIYLDPYQRIWWFLLNNYITQLTFQIFIDFLPTRFLFVIQGAVKLTNSSGISEKLTVRQSCLFSCSNFLVISNWHAKISSMHFLLAFICSFCKLRLNKRSFKSYFIDQDYIWSSQAANKFMYVMSVLKYNTIPSAFFIVLFECLAAWRVRICC